jgi:Ankyrin repeats (3 copies)
MTYRTGRGMSGKGSFGSQAAMGTGRPSAAGGRALWTAASLGDMEKALHLLSEGAYVDQRSGPGGSTPLHEAARIGHEGILLALLDGGANVSAKQTDGKTPLYIALDYATGQTFLHKTTVERLRPKTGGKVYYVTGQAGKKVDYAAGQAVGKMDYAAGQAGKKVGYAAGQTSLQGTAQKRRRLMTMSA